MATNTYTAIRTTTVGTATPSVTLDLTGITGYTDLVIVANARSDKTSTTQVKLTFNSDTASNYSWTRLLGDGSSPSSSRASSQAYVEVGYIAGNTGTVQPDMFVLNIQNYSNSTTNKTLLSRWQSMNAANQYVAAVVGLWRSTSAITSITLTPDSSNFNTGSTFTVYGIKAWEAETGTKATGGYVYTDSTYCYHAFPFSGTFTPTQTLTADYLVVGGGGGGGSYSAGGGGGAGGLRSTVSATGGGGSLESAVSLTNGTAYTITVGAGGVGAFNTSTGTSGGSSSIAGSGLTTITSTGGGYGGGYNGGHFAAATGGSGGGANYSTYTTGASGTANQGYAGGNGVGASISSGGGGGGAGAVGGNGSTSNGGDGGNGVSIPTFSSATNTGVSGYYAGGGGGASYDGPRSGNGGLGGGGNANGPVGKANPGDGFSGVTSTGSGGGAAETTTAPPSNARGGNGGSGVVIIRYPK